jgi:predicted O-methyltransferase YrrM
MVLLGRLSNAFGHEYRDWDFPIFNGSFESVDAEMTYAMVRDAKPRHIVEIGSGFSSIVMLRAVESNGNQGSAQAVISVYDPYPRDFIVKLQDEHRIVLTRKEIQRIPVDTFQHLEANDILFIDSSHVLRIDSDVQYEYLEILPRLPPGVLVHIHDIFLPRRNYPKQVVMDRHDFWNEQYLVQAFLAFNRAYEVLLSASYLHYAHPELLQAAVPSYRAGVWPGSLWLRRVDVAAERTISRPAGGVQ